VAGLLSASLFVASAGAIVVLQYVDAHVPKVDAGTDQVTGPTEPVNVLVLGSDSRARLSPKEQVSEGSPDTVPGQRSDTIILAHFDPQRNKAVLVHFPRDLLVDIPGHGSGKLNSAFEMGGPRLMVRTMKQFTGLPIHHYVEIDFVGFRNLVDALGGVRMCVDRPMYDKRARLDIPRKGCYRFDGNTALAFVRARNVEGDLIPDFARIARQQQFIRALFNKLLSVSSLTRIPSLVQLATGNVITDKGLSSSDILYLGNKLRDVAQKDPGGARSVDLRVVPSVPQDIGGVSYVVAEEDKAHRLFRALELGRRLGDLGTVQLGTEVSPAVIDVWVFDGGSPEAAEAAATLLRRAGFVVLGIRKAPPGFRSSAILFRPGEEDRALTVSGYFPDLEQHQAGARVLKGADAAVVVGRDEGPAA
jgi:LCP family protein required for cell wall assembly